VAVEVPRYPGIGQIDPAYLALVKLYDQRFVSDVGIAFEPPQRVAKSMRRGRNVVEHAQLAQIEVFRQG
jgi:hypothetical protein